MPIDSPHLVEPPYMEVRGFEDNRKRASSAPERLEGNTHSLSNIDFPQRAFANSPSSPTGSVAEALKDYKRNQANEAHELKQAVDESLETFKKFIQDQGGNPAIAHEVFLETLLIADLPESSETNDFFKNKNSYSLNDFLIDVPKLEGNEITEIVTFLSQKELKELAKLITPPAPNELFQKSKSEELRNFFKKFLVEKSQHASANNFIKHPFLENVAIIEHQGINNSGVDCYLSSALQCLRQHFSNLSPNTQSTLIASLRLRYAEYLEHFLNEAGDSTAIMPYSPLVAFLEKKFDARDPGAARLLRREVQRIMQELTHFGNDAANEIAENINSVTGNSGEQSDASEALLALMAYVGIPSADVEKVDFYAEGSPYVGQLRPSPNQSHAEKNFILLLNTHPQNEEDQMSMQEVILSNWNTTLQGVRDNDSSTHNINRQEVLANSPESLTISLKRFEMNFDLGEVQKTNTQITHITNPIDFLTSHEGELATYIPTSIVCHYGGKSASSGHYVTIQKEGDSWFMINDAYVAPFDIKRNQEFLEKNAYIINYQKVN